MVLSTPTEWAETEEFRDGRRTQSELGIKVSMYWMSSVLFKSIPQKLVQKSKEIRI